MSPIKTEVVTGVKTQVVNWDTKFVPMSAGQRIAQERMSRDWSQQELADKVNRPGGQISQTGIDKLEKRDAKRPRYSAEIAAALGVNERWLLTGKGAKEPSEVTDIDRVVRQISELEPQEQRMVLMSLQSQIDIARMKTAKLSDVQAAEIKAKSKP